ncbi:hypothetical protein C2E23DRAFT_202711 [Lenzites betulinus]|nr:hypothetical protein C2E23DRAFT_202711 [Lenzites betulinus]
MLRRTVMPPRPHTRLLSANRDVSRVSYPGVSEERERSAIGASPAPTGIPQYPHSSERSSSFACGPYTSAWHVPPVAASHGTPTNAKTYPTFVTDLRYLPRTGLVSRRRGGARESVQLAHHLPTEPRAASVRTPRTSPGSLSGPPCTARPPMHPRFVRENRIALWR